VPASAGTIDLVPVFVKTLRLLEFRYTGLPPRSAGTRTMYGMPVVALKVLRPSASSQMSCPVTPPGGSMIDGTPVFVSVSLPAASR